MNKPQEVQIDLEDPVVALAAGCSHSLALGKSGTVYVWGSNKEGQLGLGADGEESLFSPTPLTAFMTSVGAVKSISCGYYHSALVTPDADGQGLLYTFGEADGGKLGLEVSAAEIDVPTKVDIEGSVSHCAITTPEYQSCVFCIISSKKSSSCEHKVVKVGLHVVSQVKNSGNFPTINQYSVCVASFFLLC